MVSVMWKFSKLLFATVLLLVLLGCNRPNPRILPVEVSGHWTTDATGYQGRFLELSQAFVIIGAGERGNPVVQMIDNVEPAAAGDETTYTIDSTSVEGVHDQITIQFSPRNGGELRVKERPDVVWRRSSV